MLCLKQIKVFCDISQDEGIDLTQHTVGRMSE